MIKAHEQQLKQMAHFDVLTTLPNRVLLADRMHQAMAHAERRGQRLAVAYLDLDGFKAINDVHSHKTGDQLLIALAARMKHSLREATRWHAWAVTSSLPCSLISTTRRSASRC